MAAPLGDRMVGSTLGRYRLLERVGDGATGTVYRAEDGRSGVEVAVKVLDDSSLGSSTIMARFRREARIDRALRHPNIAAFYDFDEVVQSVDGRTRRLVFLVIEWVPGTDLAAVLAAESRLVPARVVAYGRQIAAALEAAHAAGVVHRDLKPGNVRITPDGVVKVLDFGFAKILEDAALAREQPSTFRTAAGSIIGTASYMAPEQLFARPVDARADLFTLGVVLYRMVAGRLPFLGDTLLEVLRSVSNDEATPIAELSPGVPAALDSLVLRLLAKDPAARPQTATIVLDELAALG